VPFPPAVALTIRLAYGQARGNRLVLYLIGARDGGWPGREVLNFCRFPPLDLVAHAGGAGRPGGQSVHMPRSLERGHELTDRSQMGS
jgi:hypothetical protein